MLLVNILSYNRIRRKRLNDKLPKIQESSSEYKIIAVAEYVLDIVTF